MAAVSAADKLVSINPHDGSIVGEVRVSRPDDVRDAVARARAAQVGWAALSFEARAAALMAAGPLLERAAEELASLAHREMGKPMKDALGEAQGIAKSIERHVEMARAAVEPVTMREGEQETTLRHDPLGVIAVITPWNFPLWMPVSLIYPALLTGNAVVHKPSEKTPLLGQRLNEILASVLPEGVLMPLVGGGDVGALLVDSDVEMVAFVGSQDVGRRIMAACAPGLKRLVLELGGKDPMIVLADADLEKAAQFAARGAFSNAGQVCCSVERILVAREIEKPFLARLVELTSAMSIGPMVDDGQRQKVVALVDDARRRGAKVLCGGEPSMGQGTHYPPTILADVTDDMEVTRREIFGPVATVRAVSSAEEALAIANAIPYGLGATVWTSDAARGEAVAGKLQSGMIGINRGIRGVGDSPWVGTRQSGYGFTGNIDGTRQFTQVRTITR